MQVLKIKDNQLNKKDVFREIGQVTRKIADKTLEQLEREGIFIFPEILKDAEDISAKGITSEDLNKRIDLRDKNIFTIFFILSAF